jgi:hypothetical protein
MPKRLRWLRSPRGSDGKPEELAAVAKPDTLLAWYRKLIANKFDGSRIRQRVGRPRIDEEAERLVLQMAKETRAGATIALWGP